MTDQVAQGARPLVQALDRLSDVQWKIVAHSDAPRAMADLLRITGYSQRAHFRSQHLEPLLRAGILRMTIPEKPRSSAQRYVLTENGIRLKAWRALNTPTT